MGSRAWYILREALLVFAGACALTLSIRPVWVSLGGAAADAPVLALIPGDIAAASMITIIWTLLCAHLPGRFLRLSIAAGLLAMSGLLLVASAKYYLNYETPFRLSHLNHVEGATQMTQSIAAELNLSVVLGVLGVLLFALIWLFAAERLLRAHPKNAPLPERFVHAGLTLLLSGGMLGLSHTADISFGSMEGGFNLIHRTAFLPETETGAHDLTDAVGRSPGSAGFLPFSGDSIADETFHQRLVVPERGKRHNIVIYLFEGTSLEYIGEKVNGRSITPNWDRLSANSLRMTGHHASNPLTINALFSLLTSAFPMPADRWAIKDFPAIPVNSLPQVLRNAGYRTGIINTGYFKYAKQINFLRNRGFDLILDVNQLRKPPFTYTLNWGIDDRALIEPAVSFVQANKEQPFFLLLKPETPHHPYDVPEPRFVVENPDDVSGARSKSRAKFRNALFFADYVLGQTIARIEEAGAADNTLFFIIADHGEAFGQHRGNYNHPFFVYQENVHVPFLVYNRRLFPQARTLKKITRHEDVAPTILEWLGLAAPAEYQGRSILRPGKGQMAFFNTTWRNDLAGLRDGRWKYIYNQKTRTAELFNLEEDPTERNNLAESLPETVRRYQERLLAFQENQRSWYERIVGRSIDWTLTMSKDGM